MLGISWLIFHFHSPQIEARLSNSIPLKNKKLNINKNKRKNRILLILKRKISLKKEDSLILKWVFLFISFISSKF